MGKSEEKIKQARRKLKKIMRGAEKEGCTLTDLIQLSASKNILGKSSKFKVKLHWRSKFWIPIIILSLLAFSLNVGVDGFSALWIKWSHKNVENELCVVSMPDELVKAFRPPVSCTICRDLNDVEKVSNLTPQVFEERYAYTGKPVVITDGMTNWTAQNVFSFKYFKQIYQGRLKEWTRHNCQFFPYGTEFRNLGEVFNMSEERADLAEGAAPWYVGWSNCDDEINQILRQHYKKPYFLPEMAETKKIDWIFIGSAGYGAPMHVDNVEHPSWQAQLKGRKKWSLQPPPECFYECQQVDVVVEPGEIIVLDTNRWYHSTLIVSDELSVTIGAEYD